MTCYLWLHLVLYTSLCACIAVKSPRAAPVQDATDVTALLNQIPKLLAIRAISSSSVALKPSSTSSQPKPSSTSSSSACACSQSLSSTSSKSMSSSSTTKTTSLSLSVATKQVSTASTLHTTTSSSSHLTTSTKASASTTLSTSTTMKTSSIAKPSTSSTAKPAVVYVSNGFVEYACYSAAPATYGAKLSSSSMTVDMCTNFCSRSGFPKYSQITNGDTCGCTYDNPDTSRKAADSMCNMGCSGNGNQLCGGQTHSQMYQSG